jgi:hypothetical protein
VILWPELALALIVTGDETVLPEMGLVICTVIADEKTEKPQRNMSANNKLSFFKMTPWVCYWGGADLGEGAHECISKAKWRLASRRELGGAG